MAAAIQVDSRPSKAPVSSRTNNTERAKVGHRLRVYFLNEPRFRQDSTCSPRKSNTAQRLSPRATKIVVSPG